MKFVADLHIHSHFSRATSKELTFEHLTKWAQLKGVQVVGTGDIAHPGWLQEMKEKLEPAEEGLFRLKDEYARPIQEELAPACQHPVRFMLAGEISSIYKKNDRVRKIHNVIFAPTLDAVEKIQTALEKIGNIRSDGRPILGLDSRDLLEIILDIDPQNYLIPAHIWTPWFSLLGSKSGFDSVEECFEDLTPHIFALETGLSSDPPMNWRISALDRYTLVSNSDAHSPPKLAREANLFQTELSYPAIFEALKTGDPNAFLGTVEFFPEEGKYHYDGHRKCDLRWHPQTTLDHGGICPVCGKPVTIGVMHRVETLADRPVGEKPAQTHPFHSLIPLPEILSEVYGVGPTSKRVQTGYQQLLARLGSELAILQALPLAEIESVGGARLAEGIKRMRAGDITVAAGYDGEYGIIKLFDEAEQSELSNQLHFFKSPGPSAKPKSTKTAPYIMEERPPFQPEASPPPAPKTDDEPPSTDSPLLATLNPQQQQAVQCTDLPLIIVAGPGTGKTRTLTHRIAYLIADQGVAPEHILAITFTNKAATEMVDRLTALLGETVRQQIIIQTFHAFGNRLLREAGDYIGLRPAFAICSDQDRRLLFKQIAPQLSDKEIWDYLDQIATAKNQLLTPDSPALAELVTPAVIDCYRDYETILRHYQLVDFDDLILRPVQLLESQPDLSATYHDRFRWLSVDEYQDINLAQYRLLQLLIGSQTNLCVIGDPDQAIYGFRGATREYFLTFQQDFPTAKRMHLSQNYRSSQAILDASGQVIAPSTANPTANLWSEVVDKTKIELYQAATEKAEAEYVVHQIEKLIGGTSYFSLDSGRVTDDQERSRSFADFAVLYRLGAQSQPLIEALERSGMPYQTIGHQSLYDYQEIKAVLAYLWFLYNPRTGLHLHQILNHPQTTFIWETLKQLGEIAETEKLSLWGAVQQFDRWSMFNPRHTRQLRRLVPFLQELETLIHQRQPVTELLSRINEFIAGQSTEPLGEASSDRFRQLLKRATPFEDRLADFLSTTVLHKETDEYDPRADRITLMTLHASKGLEFPVVFIVGCEEALLPYHRPGQESDVAEERRLLYVGMTRAQQKLVLTHTTSRFLFGRTYQPQPSRFVGDIEATLKALTQASRRKPAKPKPAAEQLTLF